MIKKLAPCVGKYKKETILSPLFMIGEALMEVLIPYSMVDLVDKGINMGNSSVIGQMGLKLVFFALVSMFCGVMGGLMSARASAGFAKNLQHKLYHHIQDFSFSNIDKFSTSGLVTRMTTDVNMVQQAFMMTIRMMFRSPCMFAFALFSAFKINSDLAKVFLAVLPILVIGLAVIVKFAFPVFTKVFKMYDKVNAVVQENVRGIRVVKAFVREDHEKKKFADVSQELYKTNVKAELIVAFNAPLMQFCMYACMIMISWFGARLVVSGNMSDGQLMSMFTYIMQILMSLMMLSMIFVMYTMAGAAAKRIIEVLDEEPDIANCEKPEMEVADGSISFEHVNFGYGKSKDCLTDINLEIKSGETIGIIGGTGSGKTSIVQLIPRLYDVRSGSVKVGGVDVRNIDLETLRKNVAMVLQKNVLFTGSVKENLRWGNPEASDEEIIRAAKLAQADGFINEFENGYDSHIEQGGSNVSGGQRQRLCIARALVSSPKILIMDDSTSAVDTATESLILKAFREDIPHVTKIIIAQRISSVKSADRIIVIDDGKINGIGNHEELMASNAIYKEVFESQNRGGDFDER